MSRHDPDRRRCIRRFLLGVAAAAWMLSCVLVVSGGVSLRIAGVPVRARQPLTSVAVGVAFAVAALAVGRRAGVGADLVRAWDTRDRWSATVAALAALAAGAIGLAWGTWAASGADAYGYVSQAVAWLNGRLVLHDPIAASAPWPSPEWTVSPLGWRPAPTPGAIVPTYAPGLPLLMALAAGLAGEQAVYWIVPCAGAALVWLTWRLGLRLADRPAAAVAATLMACSPAFLFQVVQPMSDVPAAAWFTAALLLVVAGRPAWAGACAAAAVLTRPNLAPLAGWLALGTMVFPRNGAAAAPERRLHRAAAFVLTLAPGLVAWLAINHWWYGRALASGYGAAGDLFALSNIGVNAWRYGEWLVHTQTPFILLGCATPLVWWATRRRSGPVAGDVMPVVAGDARGEPPPPGSLLDQGFALVFAGLVVVAYLPYASFEAWPYLRFLLPAFPVLLVTSAFLARRLLDHVPVPARVPLLAAAVAALCTYQGVVARQGQAFALQRLERRSVETGQWAANALPHDAVLLAVQQSGSLRHYARRPTIRWDHLEPAWLEPALAHLRGVGLVPYLVLESWEEVQFRERFSGATALGRLDWPPMAELLSTPRVRVFDPRDRAPFMAGMPLRPERISPPPPR